MVNGATVNVTLQEDYANLDEVVITGLATSVKRSNLANAVATISAKELYGVAPAQTFDAGAERKDPRRIDHCQLRRTRVAVAL